MEIIASEVLTKLNIQSKPKQQASRHANPTIKFQDIIFCKTILVLKQFYRVHKTVVSIEFSPVARIVTQSLRPQ